MAKSVRQPPGALCALGKGVAKDRPMRLTRDDWRLSKLRRRMLDDAGNQQGPFHHSSRLQHWQSLPRVPAMVALYAVAPPSMRVRPGDNLLMRNGSPDRSVDLAS